MKMSKNGSFKLDFYKKNSVLMKMSENGSFKLDFYRKNSVLMKKKGKNDHSV